MSDLGFKEITVENWMKPDGILKGFVRISFNGVVSSISGEDYVQNILEPKLINKTPIEVLKLFEVARGIMVYGYFFYPLYAIGTEQLFRVLEAAINARCKELNIPRSIQKLCAKINWLHENKNISDEFAEQLHVARKARNIVSHPDSQMILTPGNAIGAVKRIAVLISQLYG
jgi:hypothetical protein